MKQALFNTEMVRAIKSDYKTTTRRPMNPQPKYAAMTQAGLLTSDDPITLEGGLVVTPCGTVTTWDKLPYRPGGILYVRETWAQPYGGEYRYRADYGEFDIVEADRGDVSVSANMVRWHPSIHMPREAARLFLRLQTVRVERVQDITDEEARREGAADRQDFRRIWNECYAAPRPRKGKGGEIDHYESYPWEDVRDVSTYLGKPLVTAGNPWVWVVEFEPVSKAEAEHERGN